MTQHPILLDSRHSLIAVNAHAQVKHNDGWLNSRQPWADL